MWPSTLQRGKRVQRPSGSACAQGVFESSTVCCFNTARLITLLQQLEVMEQYVRMMRQVLPSEMQELASAQRCSTYTLSCPLVEAQCTRQYINLLPLPYCQLVLPEVCR